MGRPKGSKNKQEASPEPSEQQEQQPKQSSKTLYIVNYWVPFPASEYGGVQVVIADDDDECFKFIANASMHELKYHKDSEELIAARVKKAQRFLIDAAHASGLVRSFTT